MPRTLDRWTRDGSPIGLRWNITTSGDLHVGWPAPGLEHTVLSMGWLTEDAQVGIIEVPASPVDVGILEILDERFPNRRWFAGTFDEVAEMARQAA